MLCTLVADHMRPARLQHASTVLTGRHGTRQGPCLTNNMAVAEELRSSTEKQCQGEATLRVIRRPRGNPRWWRSSCAVCCGSHHTKAGRGPACVAAPLGPTTAALPCALCLWGCWRWQCSGPGSTAANRQDGVTAQGLALACMQLQDAAHCALHASNTEAPAAIVRIDRLRVVQPAARLIVRPLYTSQAARPGWQVSELSHVGLYSMSALSLSAYL
jgi:hypothetical protein